MPGLFDNFNPAAIPGGILNAGGNLLSNMAGGFSPAIHQQQLQQQIMEQTYQSLVPRLGPQGAAIATFHPEILNQMTKPITVEPGSQVVTPLNLFGGQQQPGQAQGAQGQPPQQPSQSPMMNTNGIWDQPTLQQNALRVLKTGDQSVFQHVGMGALGQVNMANLNNEITKQAKALNMSPGEISGKVAQWPGLEKAQGINAEVSTRMGTANIEATNTIPLLVDAVKTYGNSQFPPLNKALQAFSENTGDPKVVQLGQYANALLNTYSRAISSRPQGPTEGDKERAHEIINKYWNPQQIASGLQAMQNEMALARQSPQTMTKSINAEYGAGKPPPPDVQQQTRAALQARPELRSRILQRLQDHGFDSSGF